MLLFILLRPLVSHRWCIIVDKVTVILDNAAAMPHFITARLHHPQPVRGDLSATSSARQRCWYTRRRIKSFCCAELRRAAVAREPQKKKQKQKTRLNDSFHSSDESFFVSLQGTIFLPGNKVSEHPTSGDDGGKFLFEVIPGRMRSEQLKDFLSLPGNDSSVGWSRRGTETWGLDQSCLLQITEGGILPFPVVYDNHLFPLLFAFSHTMQLWGAICSHWWTDQRLN